MQSRKNSISKLILVACLYGVLFFLVFKLLQNGTIYRNTLGLISKNYVGTGTWENPQMEEKNIPFNQLSNDNLDSWDVAIYHTIKDDLYSSDEKEYQEIKTAFFPLFPIIWKIFGCDSRGIMVVNYIFFMIGLLILLYLFVENKEKVFYLIFSLAFPSSIIFFIPYSESTFFLMFSIAAYGAVKEKYIYYFIGIMLMAMTRPAGLFVALAILGADLFVSFLSGKRIGEIALSSVKKILPFIIGFFMALFIEYLYTGNLFTLFEVQKKWNRFFSIPQKIADWSVEGFGMSIFSIFFISIPSLLFLIFLFYRVVKRNKLAVVSQQADKKNEPTANADFIYYLSVLYMAGMFIYYFFYTGGLLNSFSRLTLATPFFFCIIFQLKRKLCMIKTNKIVICFGAIMISMVLALSIIQYGLPRVSFKFLGLYLALAFSITLTLSIAYHSKNIYYLLLIVFAFIAIVWQSYLLNMLLSTAWIFT